MVKSISFFFNKNIVTCICPLACFRIVAPGGSTFRQRYCLTAERGGSPASGCCFITPGGSDFAAGYSVITKSCGFIINCFCVESPGRGIIACSFRFATPRGSAGPFGYRFNAKGGGMCAICLRQQTKSSRAIPAGDLAFTRNLIHCRFFGVEIGKI